MKWVLIVIVFFFVSVFSPLYYVYGQDVKQQNQLLSIQEILSDCDMSISNLEWNMKNYNQIIQDLSLKVNSMQTTINIQQRQLRTELTNSADLEATMKQRSQNYENTLQSLEKSLTASLKKNEEQNDKILKLTEKNAKQTKCIFILAGILSLILIFAIVRIIIAVKTNGIKMPLKVLFGRLNH